MCVLNVIQRALPFIFIQKDYLDIPSHYPGANPILKSLGKSCGYHLCLFTLASPCQCDLSPTLHILNNLQFYKHNMSSWWLLLCKLFSLLQLTHTAKASPYSSAITLFTYKTLLSTAPSLTLPRGLQMEAPSSPFLLPTALLDIYSTRVHLCRNYLSLSSALWIPWEWNFHPGFSICSTQDSQQAHEAAWINVP